MSVSLRRWKARRPLVLRATILVAALIACGSVLQAANVTFVPSSSNISTAGGTTSVQVVIDNPVGVDAYNLGIVYPAGILGVTPTPVLNPGCASGAGININNDGSICMAFSCSLTGMNVTLATITFFGDANGTAPLTFGTTACGVNACNLEALPSTPTPFCTAGTGEVIVGPTVTPTQTASRTASNTPTMTPTRTPTQTPSFSPSATASRTPSNTPTQTPTPTASQTPSNTPTRTASGTPSDTPTQTQTRTPSITPSLTPTRTASGTPSETPTATASRTASNTPTVTPTRSPSNTPSLTPTRTPSGTPSDTPTRTATRTASNTPSVTPTRTPSGTPTETPTATASRTPSNTPSVTPTRTPSNTPTQSPTRTPTGTPTETPTMTNNENTAGDQFCHDLFDNDFDGLIDCADPDCAAVPPCSNVAPTMSPSMTAVLAATLAFVGLLGVSRARRRSTQ